MKLLCLETSGTKYPVKHSYTQEELYFKQVFVVFMLIKINRPISNILNNLYCFSNLRQNICFVLNSVRMLSFRKEKSET
jgi:hypothetical protein